MVALPTLYPITPDGTVTTMQQPAGAATYAEAMRTNDGDTSYATAGLDTAGSVFVNLDDTPTDFGTMNSLTVSCIVRLNGTRVDDTTQLYAQVFAADETTALTDEIFVTDHTTGNTYTIDSTALVLTATGTSATKADWDGAKLKLRWAFTKTAKSDTISLRVTQAYLDGDYGAITPTVTGAVAMSASSSVAAIGSAASFGLASTSASSTMSTIGSVPRTDIEWQVSHLFNEGFYTGATTTTSVTTVTGAIVSSATSTVAATGTVTTSGTAAMNATGTQLNVFFAQKFGLIAASATSTLSTTSTVEITGASTQSASSTLAATASTSTTGTITMAASATMVASSGDTLATPTNVVAVADSPTQVTVTWDIVSGAEVYDVERGGNIIDRVTTTSYTDINLSPQTTYTYRVRAVKFVTA